MDNIEIANALGHLLHLFTQLKEIEKRQADYLEEIIEEQRRQTVLFEEIRCCAGRK